MKRYRNESNISSFLNKKMGWFRKIIDANNKVGIYKNILLGQIIYERWFLVCALNTKEGILIWKKFRSSKLFKLGGNKRTIDSLKILTKSILKL